MILMEKVKTRKPRSEFKIGKRVICSTRKEAFELAKLYSDLGLKPELHGGERPHYHPNIKPSRKQTPKAVSPHDHYYFPKRFY